MCGSDLIMFGLSSAAVIVSMVTISMWWNGRKRNFQNKELSASELVKVN